MSKDVKLDTENAYYFLFKQVSCAIDELEKQNYRAVLDILVAAQRAAEEIAISED